MFFKYRKDAQEYGKKRYKSFTVWYDSDRAMFYVLP